MSSISLGGNTFSRNAAAAIRSESNTPALSRSEAPLK